jgi:hypothetical protein
MAPTKRPLTITDLKILRGQVYATLSVQSADTATTSLTVKLGASHKGLSEALQPLHDLVKEAAEKQLGEAVLDSKMSQARLSARQEVAGQVLNMIKRGTMPTELERALRPLAGPNHKP